MTWRTYALAALTFFHFTTNAATIRVTDHQGQPLANMSVLIGTAQDQPFQGNKLQTDTNGNFESPKAWVNPLPVTIEGADTVRTTLEDVMPTVGQIQVSRADGNQRIEIKGTLTNYGQIRTDGKVDVGAFIPALKRSELVYFDIGWMVSPETDTLPVLMSEVAVPSNIALPKQTEYYGLFAIELNKPTFRMFVRRPGNYRFLAVHAQAPLKRVVDDIRAGAPAYDVINHGSLIQSGVVDLNVNQPISNLSVPVNTIQFTNTVPVQAPAMASDDVILSVAFSELDGTGELVPSDVKRIRSGQNLNLKAPATKSGASVLSAWLKETSARFDRKSVQEVQPEDLLNLPEDLLFWVFQNPQAQNRQVDFKQVSFALHSATGAQPKFIGHVAPPEVSASGLKFTPPTAPAQIEKLKTLVILSSIKKIGTGKVQTEQRTRLWEVSTSGWVDHVDLPAIPAPGKGSDEKLRWEVMYLGSESANSNQNQLEQVTHVSRNAVDL